MMKLAIYSNTCWLFIFFPTSLVLMTVMSLAILHKRPEALARYYVSSHRQAEWVKKRSSKTIECPPPSPPPPALTIFELAPPPMSFSFLKQVTNTIKESLFLAFHCYLYYTNRSYFSMYMLINSPNTVSSTLAS